LSGQLRLDTDRTVAQIGRTTGVAGQHLQHVMTNSPWSARTVCQPVQRAMAATPVLHGGMRIVDESAVAKTGEQRAGASRQWNGHLGKSELSQVATLLASAKGPLWTWVDGDLVLPQAWCTPAMAPLEQRLGIPGGRPVATTLAVGWRMSQRVQAAGLPCRAVACAALSGRSHWVRTTLAAATIRSRADVPRTLTL
jgi:hypothetical protein